MEFESSPGGWDDISSSDVDEAVILPPSVHYSEEAYSDEELSYQPRQQQQRTTARQPAARQAANSRQAPASGQPRKVNPLSGTSFLDRLPNRGPIDEAISDWVMDQFDGNLSIPFKKIGRVDGCWLFGLRRIKIKIGQKTGQPFVDLGANSMLLLDFWGQYEYTEQRKIDGAAAGTQALLQLLQQA